MRCDKRRSGFHCACSTGYPSIVGGDIQAEVTEQSVMSACNGG